MEDISNHARPLQRRSMSGRRLASGETAWAFGGRWVLAPIIPNIDLRGRNHRQHPNIRRLPTPFLRYLTIHLYSPTQPFHLYSPTRNHRTHLHQPTTCLNHPPPSLLNFPRYQPVIHLLSVYLGPIPGCGPGGYPLGATEETGLRRRRGASAGGLSGFTPDDGGMRRVMRSRCI